MRTLLVILTLTTLALAQSGQRRLYQGTDAGLEFPHQEYVKRLNVKNLTRGILGSELIIYETIRKNRPSVAYCYDRLLQAVLIPNATIDLNVVHDSSLGKVTLQGKPYFDTATPVRVESLSAIQEMNACTARAVEQMKIAGALSGTYRLHFEFHYEK